MPVFVSILTFVIIESLKASLMFPWMILGSNAPALLLETIIIKMEIKKSLILFIFVSPGES